MRGFLVDVGGIEPPTSVLSGQRSTTELHIQCCVKILAYFFEIVYIKTVSLFNREGQFLYHLPKNEELYDNEVDDLLVTALPHLGSQVYCSHQHQFQ